MELMTFMLRDYRLGAQLNSEALPQCEQGPEFDPQH